MGRKKRDLSYLKPFCYYCDKVFNNEIILHQHQKAKHFTCQSCHKKFSTVSSMSSHISSVHKENINKVPNAIQGRDSVELNIFGMQGVPRHLIDERILTGAANYWAKVKNEQTLKSKKEKQTKIIMGKGQHHQNNNPNNAHANAGEGSSHPGGSNSNNFSNQHGENQYYRDQHSKQSHHHYDNYDYRRGEGNFSQHQSHIEHIGSFNQPISFNIMGNLNKPAVPQKPQNFGGDIFRYKDDHNQGHNE